MPRKEGLGAPHSLSSPPCPRYELRCIVWNTCEVELEETNIMGEHMSDIYVKGYSAPHS